MLRVTTAVELNNGIWSFDIFSNCLNELYKITTPISFTTHNVAMSIGVAFFVLMLYETYKMQNKKNIQENTYRDVDKRQTKNWKVIQQNF